MRMVLGTLFVTLLAAVACGAEPQPAGELVFSLRTWEGEYTSKDVPGGVETVAYTSTIHTIKTDGTGLHQVTRAGQIADVPSFNPDGRWLYYQAKASSAYEVFRCKPDGSDAVSVASAGRHGAPWKDAFGYSLSRDGRRMVYTINNRAGDGRVVVANADGSEPRIVAPKLGYVYMSGLSPTGDAVAFCGPATGYRLKLAPLPDGPLVDLTPDHPESFVPRFTADGKTVVFFRRDGDVYRVGADGKGLRRLTEGNGYTEFRLSAKDKHGSSDPPDISPDGRRIAYVAVKDGVAQVCTMDIDGGQQRQITQRKTPCGRVRWSPDGKYLAFVSFEGEYPQLFVVAAEGGETRQVTKLKGAVTQLAWRPAVAPP